MGWVIQGELTRSVLKISGDINCFYLLENLHFCVEHEHVYDNRCSTKVTLKQPWDLQE